MIAGSTTYDADQGALSSIAGIWGGGGSVANRVDALRTSSTVPLTLGGSAATVLDDGAADRVTGRGRRGLGLRRPDAGSGDRELGGPIVNDVADATVPGHGNGNGNGNGQGHGNH